VNAADVEYLKKALPQWEAPAGGAYRLPGKVLALAAGYVTKSLDRGRMTIDSVLTYPGRDYDDDTVNPAGGDWQSEFPRNPVVNWTHREPIGRGSVPQLKSFGGHDLPVGTTHFFQSAADLRGLRLVSRDGRGEPTVPHTPRECLEAAESAFRMVADDVASGVSLEFKGTEFWPTGRKSLTLGRDAMHWEKWTGYGWAHALQCVNPNARTILPAAEDRLEKAFRIAETGTFPGGQKVSPLILKAFAPLRDRKPKFVRVERKAMDTIDDAPPGVDTVAPAADKPAGGGMKPTPKLIMTAMQHFKDGTAMIREAVEGETVEHEGGIDILTDYADKFDALLSKMNAEAAKEFPDAGFGSADPTAAEPDGDEMPVETNDDGAITNKAFPGGFPVRFRVAAGGGYERVETRTDETADAGDATILAKAIADKKAEYERRLRRAERRADRLDRVAENNRRNGRL